MSDTSITGKPDLPLPPLPPPDVAKKPRPGCGRLLLLVLAFAVPCLAMLVLGFVLGLLTNWHPDSPMGGPQSVAVLPFTGDWRPQQEAGDWQERRRLFLESTIPDAVTKDLVAHAQPGSLKVIATHEIRMHIGQDRSPSNVGTMLGVRAVVSGKVNRDGLLTVQLIAVPSGELLWSQSYNLAIDQNGNPNFVGASDIGNNVRQKLAARR
jgi:TolB-like protein